MGGVEDEAIARRCIGVCYGRVGISRLAWGLVEVVDGSKSTSLDDVGIEER